MPINGFELSSWLFDDERVQITVTSYFESGKSTTKAHFNMTREEFLSFFAHLSVIEMNMKK